VILVVAAALAAAAVIAGVVAVAGADSSVRLPTLTAPELLAEMGRSHGQTQAVSGEVTWTNRLFGDIAAAADGAFGAMPAQNPLLAGGSGRIWMSADGLRIESQGGTGDQVLVVNARGKDAWTYDYASDTARHLVATGAGDGAKAAAPPASPAALAPDAVAAMLQRLGPLGAVTVDGQTTVAGRDAYVLAFRPAATDTALGSVTVAVDGATYVPLRLEVSARGATGPALAFGFASVSYDPIDPSRFAFSPPEGASVTTTSVDAAALRERMAARGRELEAEARRAVTDGDLRRAFLTKEQAQKLAPFELATAGEGTRPFRWAFVLDEGQGMPLTVLGAPLLDLGGDPGPGAQAGDAAPAGPAVAQVYGSGLGAILLLQAPAGEEQGELALPGVVDTLDLNGHEATAVTTPLGGVVVWRQDGTTLVAAGMVPAADLRAFAGSVR
jgi:hypothetical protein